MLDESSKTALLPFLLSILKGTELKHTALQPTEFLFATKNNVLNPEKKGFDIENNSVALVNIHHPIFKYDQSCGPKGTQTIIQHLEALEGNPNIKGVVLDFNSGGGQASGNAEFFEFIKNYSKPVVSFTKDVIGSAAYYMASASDYIFAHKHADFIGSIGTMFSKLDLTAAMEKAGVNLIEEYSDLSPEKNKLSRTLKDGDTSVLIKEYLNPMAEEFHNDVKSARPNISEKALKGDVFKPAKSLKLGLIDQIGTLQDAINKVFELSENNKNTNTTTMSKNYTAIQETLGLEVAFESNNDAGFFLSEEQMQVIEEKLAGSEGLIGEAIAPLNTKITELEGKVATAQTQSENITNAITKALETAEITEELSNEDAVNALANKVVEYGQLDGAQHTRTTDDGSDDLNEQNNIVGGIDISAAMNN
jgi:protease-4